MIICLILFCTVAVINAESAIDYCDWNCKVNGTDTKHLGCGETQNWGIKCLENTKLLLDDYLKKLIVNEFNVKRNYIAAGVNSTLGRACRMTAVQWDDELARISTFSVKKCDNDAIDCFITNKIRYQMKYHKFHIESSDSIAAVLIEAIKFWFTRVDTDYVNDATTRLGCAVAGTSSSNGLPDAESVRTEVLFIACLLDVHFFDRNKHPKCNKAGSSCETGKHEIYRNLCSEDEQY